MFSLLNESKKKHLLQFWAFKNGILVFLERYDLSFKQVLMWNFKHTMEFTDVILHGNSSLWTLDGYPCYCNGRSLPLESETLPSNITVNAKKSIPIDAFKFPIYLSRLGARHSLGMTQLWKHAQLAAA